MQIAAAALSLPASIYTDDIDPNATTIDGGKRGGYRIRATLSTLGRNRFFFLPFICLLADECKCPT